MNMKVDKAFVERVIFKSSSFYLEPSFWKCGMLFGADLSSADKSVVCAYLVCRTLQLAKQITVLSICYSFEADEVLELLLISWFLLILYQSNLKLTVHVSYYGNPASVS